MYLLYNVSIIVITVLRQYRAQMNNIMRADNFFWHSEKHVKAYIIHPPHMDDTYCWSSPYPMIMHEFA